MIVTTPVEIVAVVASLLAVVLTVRKNAWCWPVGLIGVAAYFLLFLDIRLYADMGLQVVFFAQGVYGWWFWLRGGEGARPAPVRRLGRRGRVGVAAGIAAASLLLGAALARFTDASLPWIDSFVAITSLAANGLLARKVLESWWLWIVADVVYVGMFVAKGVMLTAGLYAVFLALATAGLVRWLGDAARERAGGARRFRRGFVLGKFMPLHAGHLRLIDAAAAACDDVTILVCTSPAEPIPERLRVEWVRAVYPQHRVVHVSEGQPSYPEDHPDFEAIWTDLLRRHLPDGVEVFYCGEAYGEDVARWLGIEHVLVDRRDTPGLHATAVRRDPWAMWEHLPPPVRAHYALRVALVGPESTGKSTLARRLAERFGTVHVQEYGREHTAGMESVRREIVVDDFVAIAREHARRLDEAAARADRILFADTDLITTAVWADLYLGGRPAEVAAAADAQRVDLHLLCAPDIPWEDDGTREFGHLRERHFEMLEGELARRGARYAVVRGTGDARLEAAVAAVQALLDDRLASRGRPTGAGVLAGRSAAR